MTLIFMMLALIMFVCQIYVYGNPCPHGTCKRATFCVQKAVGERCVYYQDRTDQLDYYYYMISLVKELINEHTYNYNFVIGQDFNYRNFVPDNHQYAISNGIPILKFGYSYEHTLVRPGEQYSDNTQIGSIPVTYMNRSEAIENYLVRLEPSYYSQVNSFDIVFEYSMGNILNIMHSNMSKYDLYMKKLIYIAPTSTYYNHQPNYYFSKIGRDIHSVSTFQHVNGRRSSLIDKIKKENINHINKNGLKFQQLLDLYKTSKILVNIHQTDHHHTLEEYRIVPALLYGCIIISEYVPLIDSIPFHSFILFTSFDNITAVMKDVIQNYDTYWENIFGKRLYDNNSV